MKIILNFFVYPYSRALSAISAGFELLLLSEILRALVLTMLVNQKIVLYLFINDSLRSCLCVLSSERELEILDELGMNKTIPATSNTSTQGPIPVIKKRRPTL